MFLELQVGKGSRSAEQSEADRASASSHRTIDYKIQDASSGGSGRGQALLSEAKQTAPLLKLR